MRSYSPFFQTLYDEPAPIGNIGRGTHYSILRAVVFHDPLGRPIAPAWYHDFAVIWDEDHDERSIDVIETIYRHGLLSRFVYLGERKGTFTSVLITSKNDPQDINKLRDHVGSICQKNQDDPWPSDVVTLAAEENKIIQDQPERSAQYLLYIDMLWQLGPKPVTDDKGFPLASPHLAKA